MKTNFNWQDYCQLKAGAETRQGESAIIANPITDPACWSPQQFNNTASWRFHLSTQDIDLLRSLAEIVRSRISDSPNALLDIPRKELNLGSFGQSVAAMFEVLKDGPGVVLLRGLPIEDMEMIDAAIIYWALGRQLGTACPNNPEGDMFGHITDLGKTQSDANSRGYQTREAMDYHCDQCDIVGLLCVRKAKSGGISKLASSVAMYNTLLQENPRYIELLSDSFYWTKHGEHAPDELPWYRSPVFNFLDGKLCTSFGPKHIYKGHDLDGVPQLSVEQQHAVKRAEQIAEDLHIEMELQPGDMQFVNNYVCVHTRSAYVDHEDAHHKRLLWRLWLMNDKLRSRTDYAKQWLHGVTVGNRKTQIRLQ